MLQNRLGNISWKFIDMADQGSIEIQRSRFIEQEFLDLLDKGETG
jgi:hypothetical protein